MKKDHNLKVLLIPGDTPPRRSQIKKNLLYFNTIYLPPIADKALINFGDVEEVFPNGFKFKWGDRVAYARSDDYEQVYSHIIDETSLLQNRGILRILNDFPTQLDVGINWSLYHSAISSKKLVLSAVPDGNEAKAKVQPPASVLAGGTAAPTGYRSQYELESADPYKIKKYDESWTGVSWTRIGRAIKYLRTAYAESAHPLCLDDYNVNILKTLSSIVDTPGFPDDELANRAIALDVVDADKLEKELLSVSWDETLKIRKEILPHVSSLRDAMISRASKLRHIKHDDIDSFRSILHNMKEDYRTRQEDLRNAWRAIGLTSFQNIASTSSLAYVGYNQGISAFASCNTVPALLILLLSYSLIEGVKLTSSISNLVMSKRKVKKHNMYFFDSYSIKPG